MKYKEVSECLNNTFPDLYINDISEGLPYCVAGDFAEFLLELYIKNDISRVKDGLDFIEKLYHSKDPATKARLAAAPYPQIYYSWRNTETIL